MNYVNSEIDLSKSIFANFVLMVEGGGVMPDYGFYIAQYLGDIGMNIEVKTEEWSVFPGIPSLPSFDMRIVDFEDDGDSPDMREYYTDGGSKNIFLLAPDIPYGALSEQMQQEGINITDLNQRQQHYYDWQELMMDKIVPMLPLYAQRKYVATWGNTLGYEGRWGIAGSLPYMEYEGYHEGQTSLTEFNMHGNNWGDLLPSRINDESEELIWDLVSEPVLQFSPDLVPLITGIVFDWEEVEDFHYKFYLRDNVYWNPSYNTTERDEGSIPLSAVPAEQLMKGLKNNETSDGTNQQVTAKDAVFTLSYWASNLLNEESHSYDWISDLYVDPVDPLVFHLHIDGLPDTPQNEHYVDFWSKMNVGFLPEFFLNSSRSDITYTDGGAECRGLYPEIVETPQWSNYSYSAFGCGKYMLDYSIKDSITVLRKNPNWLGIGGIDGTTQDLDIETINILIISNEIDQFNEFVEGKLDWCSADQVSSLSDPWGDPTYDIQTFISNSLRVLAFDIRRPLIGGTGNFEWLNEPGKENYTVGVAIRKAICYAIDRDEMNQILHNGEYLIAHSVLFPYTAYYYYNDIIKYDFNLDKSKEWLGAVLGGIPDFTVDIENKNNFHDNITLTIDYGDSADVVSTVVRYKINSNNWQEHSMNEENDNVFVYNFGSSFNITDNVTFYLKIATAKVGQFISIDYFFIVGTEYTTLPSVTISFSLFGLILLIPYLIAKKRKLAT